MKGVGGREITPFEEVLFALMPSSSGIPSYPSVRGIHLEVRNYLRKIVKRSASEIETMAKKINRVIGSRGRVQQLACPESYYFDDAAEVPPWPWAETYSTDKLSASGF